MLKNRQNIPCQLLAIIPARSGSKRIPGKNIKPFAGKPLLVHSVECALNTPSVSRVIVSTDSPEIREIAIKSGADAPFLRPAELASDLTSTVDVVLHAIHFLSNAENLLYESLVVLAPTSPLRTVGDVEAAFQLFQSSAADSLVSLAQTPINSACLTTVADNAVKPLITDSNFLFRLNGAIYISRTESILKTGKLLGEKTIPYFMPDLLSVDIDTPSDFLLAEILMKQNSMI